jgi:hypothetical protein
MTKRKTDFFIFIIILKRYILFTVRLKLIISKMEKVLKRKGLNPLLVQDEVGHCKPTTRSLPPTDFAFGKSEKKDPEGANKGNNSNNCSYVFLVVPQTK